MNQYKHRMSPLTALFLGATMTIVTIVVSVSMITLYGMNLGSRWGNDLIALTAQTIDGLPEIASSLPPILADALNDRRAPEYVDRLRAEVEPVPAPKPPGWRPVVAIENRGDRMVTLLSLRVVALDDDGVPVAEWSEYAATPAAVDHDWRGPLMPRSTRRFAVGGCRLPSAAATAELEITDIRVWTGPNEQAEPAAELHGASVEGTD